MREEDTASGTDAKRGDDIREKVREGRSGGVNEEDEKTKERR